MTKECIEISFADGVQTIRMNRPEKKNAITGDMYAAMAEGLDQAKDHDDTRCVLILGTPGCFTAGNDIADFLQVAMSGERGSMAVFDFLERIIMAAKPTVAGVDGLAIGVGTTMLFHCDYVVSSDQAKFKTPFVDLGLVPEAGSSLILPSLVGHHNAFGMLAGIDTFSAEDARNAGFVQKIVDAAALEEEATVVAKSIAAKPAEAMKLTRDLVRPDRSDVLERMREEAKIFGERLQSNEARQAFTAFMSRG